MSSSTEHINNWLFQGQSSKNSKKISDTMKRERRDLLNLHLDGDLSKPELQKRLLELKDG